jgi:hypothetical protein
MPKKVEHPFCVPPFATTQGIAAAGLALMAHPTGHLQILNQCSSLYCTRNFLSGFTAPQITVPYAGISNFKMIEAYALNFRFSYPYYMDIIKQMLDEGFYVYFSGVDDYYLPGKSWYGTRHMPHDGIICGYDDFEKTFSIAAHDMDWIFSLITVPQQSFAEGLDFAISEKHYGHYTGYKIREGAEAKIDEKEMFTYLKGYLDSDFEKYPKDKEGGVLGTVVQDYIAIYIDKLIDGSIPYEKMDWRAIRPIWEHKKCMLERIRAIEEKHKWEKELSEEYAPLVPKINNIRMSYAFYHKRRRDSMLVGIRDGILQVKETEEDILKRFIERLESLI